MVLLQVTLFRGLAPPVLALTQMHRRKGSYTVLVWLSPPLLLFTDWEHGDWEELSGGGAEAGVPVQPRASRGCFLEEEQPH